MSFELNRGQADEPVRFLARGRGYTLLLSPTDTALALNKDRSEPAIVHMKLAGANPKPEMAGVDELPGKVNYFIGNDPKQWHANVPTYAKVQFKDVYPGIDLIYYGNQSQLEYDFVVAPGADPHSIRLKFDASQHPAIDASGDLVLEAGHDRVSFKKPFVYQAKGNEKRRVPTQYVLLERNEIGLHIDSYDLHQPLVIDPVLTYSTYVGGSGIDRGTGIAADASGNAYITGYTNSPARCCNEVPNTDFPRVNPLQSANGGGYDVFVAKLNSAGSALIYSTYLGGSGNDGTSGATGDPYFPGIAIDGGGNAYVAGYTNSTNFPTMNPIQAAIAGQNDIFVTKLNATGSALVYSTYLGGSLDDLGSAIAVDSSGNAYVTGATTSTNFPTANAFQPARAGTDSISWDAFVTKINSAGSALIYSTYLGGAGGEYAYAIAADNSGNAYVTGSTGSSDFPVHNAFQPGNNGMIDAFVTKLSPSGSALVYSTYLGGSDVDEAHGIAVDPSGNAYLTGVTRSFDFPLKNPIPPRFSPCCIFVSQLNAGGFALVYSTYVGDSSCCTSANFGKGIAVDASGNAYFVYIEGGSGYHAAKLNPAGSAFLYDQTFGTGTDPTIGIATDGAGNAYVITTKNNGNALQDAWVLKLFDGGPPVVTAVSPSGGALGATLSATINGTSLAGATAVTFSGTGVTAAILSGNTDSTLPVSISIASNAAPGLRTFTVTNPNGTSSPFSGFTVLNRPAVTALTPSSGVQGLITKTTLTGTDLSGATVVSVSGGAVAGTILSGGTATSVPVSLSIVTTAPIGARTVTVTTPGGTSAPFNSFNVTSPANISSGVPISSSLTATSAQSGLRSGRYAERYQFTLSATRGVTISEQSTSFDAFLYLLAADGTVISQDDDSGGNSNALIRATLGPGTYIVEATSYSAGQLGNYTLSMTTGPAITSISPSQGTQGTTVAATITGNSLAGATAVTFSGTGVTGTVTSSAVTTAAVTIAIASDAAANLRTLSITTPEGTSPAFNGFTVVSSTSSAPTINAVSANPSGLSQAVAPLFGGPFALTVNGTNFASGAIVSLGTTSLATTRVSDTQLTAQVTPAALMAIGSFGVKVTNPDAQSSNAVPLNVVPRGDFNANTKVNIGDALALALNVGGSTRPLVPNSIGDFNLSGAANIGDALVLALFAGRVNANYAVPVVSSVSPSPAVRSGSLTITGNGFAPNATDNLVLFTTANNIIRVAPSVASINSLTVTVPPDAVSGPLQVYRADTPLGGTVFPLSVSATATPLLLASVSPYNQVLPGASLILTGLGFDATAANDTVRFRTGTGTGVAAVTSASTTSLTVNVPSDAICGPVTVTTGGQTSNARMVVVQTVNPCDVQLVDLWGAGAPGETVILEGSGFDPVTPTNNVVLFQANGGTVAAPVLAAGGTQLHVRIPNNAIDGNVTVTVGTASSNTFVYHRPNVMSPSSIDVVVNSPDAVGSYQVTIGYNPAIVTVDPANVRGGTGAGFTGTPASISVNNIAGTVTFNAFQTSSAPTGQFTVANVTFTPVSPGTSNLTLSNVTLTDTSGAELPASRVSLSNATITVTRNP